MSALPPKADIGTQPRDVRFVPKADISISLTVSAGWVIPLAVPAVQAAQFTAKKYRGM